jgi:hypothetical protein
MPLTAGDWLGVLEPRLTEPLFGAEAVRRLRRVAANVPGEGRGILEARLAPGEAPVDLSLGVHTPAQARALAACLPLSSTRDFLLRWSELEGPLAPVRSVWLELDLDREPERGALPPPILCAKLPRDSEPGWLLGTLFPALTGRPLPAHQRDRLVACLSALPASAFLLYAFDLKARGNEAIRLEIFGLEPVEIPVYLREVAPGAAAGVAEIAPAFEGVERIHLSFDIAEGIQPQIGLEGSFPRQPRREPRWRDLFGRLIERGLCSPAKRDTVLAWPGYDTFWTAPDRWPVDPLGPGGSCIRVLSHIKVVCHPDRDPEAKVYLAFGPPDGSNEEAPASSPASRSALST